MGAIHSDMSAAAQPLLELQDLDVQIEGEHSAIESIRRRLASSQEIESARRRLSEQEARLQTAQTELRRLDTDAQDLRNTITRLNSRLYGGSVHDSRELASIEAEISHATKRQVESEDRELELMEEIESLTASLEEGRGRLERLESDRAAMTNSLLAERQSRQTQLDSLVAARQERVQELPPARLSQYERLRERLGHAVSAVDGGVCQWCRVQLPPADVQHARGPDIVLCTNCGRILCPAG